MAYQLKIVLENIESIVLKCNMNYKFANELISQQLPQQNVTGLGAINNSYECGEYKLGNKIKIIVNN